MGTFILDVFNILPAGAFIILPIGLALFPGGELLVSICLAVPTILVYALIYTQFSIIFPRSGGEYVFIGRTIHPSLGFMANFVEILLFISSCGGFTVWLSAYGFGPMFSVLGTLWGSTSVSSLATIFSVPENIFIIGVLSIFVMNGFMLLGTRVALNAMKVLFVIAYAGIVGYIVAVAALPHSSFVANFNSLSPLSYDQVIATAQASGASVGFNWTDTFGAIVFVNLAALGFMCSSYTGGEVRNPRRSQLIGIVGSALFICAVMFVIVAVSYLSMGRDFLASISYLGIMGNPNYPLSAVPIASVIAGYGTRNALLEIFLGVAILTSLFGVIISESWAASRQIFAWSFDAVIPTKFAQIDDRFHSPVYALILMIILEVLFAYLYVFTPLMTYFVYLTTGQFTILAILGVAGVLFPYGRWKNLLDASPAIVKRKIAGIPLIAIMGALSIVDGVAIAYLSAMPQISGPIQPAYLGFLAFLFAIGFVVYWISYAIQKARGVRVDLMHKEIPPE
jgi:APA family basic amino acid/polyamine antiporter